MFPVLGLLPKVCALISFILTVLCLFAGSQNFLQDASIMTVCFPLWSALKLKMRE